MYLSTMEAQESAAFFSGRPEPLSGDLDMDDDAEDAAGAFSNAPVDLQAHFLSDLSQSQNMLFEPNTSINMVRGTVPVCRFESVSRSDCRASWQQQWTFVNTGGMPWPPETALVFAQGSDFGGPQQIPVSAAPGERIDIQTSLQLPSAAGSYAGSWRLRAPQGFFGDPVWIVLNVGHGGAGPDMMNLPQQQQQQGMVMPVNPLDPSKIQELHAAGGGNAADGAGFAPGVVEDMDL
jgi:hypothetical protein